MAIPMDTDDARIEVIGRELQAEWKTKGKTVDPALTLVLAKGEYEKRLTVIAREIQTDFQSPKCCTDCERTWALAKERFAEITQESRDAAKEAGMKDAGDVLLSLQSISEGSSNAGSIDMTVGLAAKLKGEIAEMNKERGEVERLRLIIENLPSKGTFALKFDELRYFEF
jgi:hypothetical protein